MRITSFVLATVFSVAAILFRLAGVALIWAIGCLVIAGGCLVYGFWKQSQLQAAARRQPLELTPEQQAELRRLKAQGRASGAIAQVKLWYRQASEEQARAAVDAA